jgi:hypothetical protein
MITKKQIIEVISSLFSEVDIRNITISDYDVKISIWQPQYSQNSLKNFIKVLQIIDASPLIDSVWDVWREEGYYNDTSDITLNFTVNKDAVKKLLKNNGTF